MQKHYRYIVLGAGVSGLASALKLAEKFPGQVLLLEKEKDIGGLAKTIKLQDDLYDLGSHRLHIGTSEEILDLIEQYSPGSLIKKQRHGKLKLFDQFINYPLNFPEFLKCLGPIKTTKALRDLSLAKISFGSHANYEDALRSKVGHYIYDVFYGPYARKVWKMDPKKISDSAAKLRFSTSSPLLSVIQMFFSSNENAYYYYTRGGIGTIVTSLYKAFRQSHGNVLTGVYDFSLINNTIETVSDEGKQTFSYDKLISTIPLDVLCEKTKLTWPGDQLGWNDLKLIFLKVQGQLLNQNTETYYFPETKYPFGRVSIPSKFDAELVADKTTINLTCEVPISRLENGITDEEALEGLKQAKVISDDSTLLPSHSNFLRLNRLYPLYKIGWQTELSNIIQKLNNAFPNILLSGRMGLYLHCNIDHSIQIGFDLASHLINECDNNSWIDRISQYQDIKVRD